MVWKCSKCTFKRSKGAWGTCKRGKRKGEKIWYSAYQLVQMHYREAHGTSANTKANDNKVHVYRPPTKGPRR